MAMFVVKSIHIQIKGQITDLSISVHWFPYILLKRQHSVSRGV